MLSRNKDGTADGMDVKVVENADNCVHITMPAAPAGHLTLSDEELRNAAGGGILISTEHWKECQATC